MSYNISLTNGSILTTISDGTVDNTTNLNLVGRNYSGYGIFLNENFVKLLENASSATAPTNPLNGQLWWNSTAHHLNIWQGTNWKVISSSATGTAAPSYAVEGDFWWNSAINQFYVYNGSQWIIVGPAVPPGAAITGIESGLVSDGITTHYIGNLIVNNRMASVFSAEASSFNPVVPVGGLTTINPGLNMIPGLGITSGNANITSITSNSISTNSISANTLTVSGNVTFTGNFSAPSTSFANFAGNIVPSANLSYNLGSSTSWWNNIYGTSIHAQYADLAERFETDIAYEPGTVVQLGGPAEITAVTEDLSDEVFGVISTRAAFVMNGVAGNDVTHPPIAVQGRVPVKVVGKVKKGQRLVSAGNGIARAGSKQEITTWNVIGRSLEDKTTDEAGVIEAVVKLNS